MKFTIYFRTFIIFFLTTIGYGQALKQVPDSLSPEKKASWYFQEANEAMDQIEDHPRSLKYFNEGYKIAIELENDSLIHVGTYYKGLITLGRGEDYYDEAEKIFKESLEYFIDNNNLLLAGKVCNQLGALALKRGNDEETEKYFNLSYEYMTNSTRPINAVTPAYNLAFYYKNKGKYDKAIEPSKWVDEMYTNFLQNNNISKTDITKYKIKYIVGICYVNLDRYDLGMQIVRNSLSAYKETKYYKGIKEVYTDLRTYELKKWNYQKAVSLSDSIIKYNLEQYKHKEKQTNKYADDIKTMDNMSLQLDLANKEIELKEEKNTKLVWSLSLAAILILSLFAISLLLKKKNSTLESLKVKAEEGVNQKSKFISMISHEVRTPLNALLGFSKLLLEENPKQIHKKHINAIVSSADYLLNLVNNVLSLNDSENTFMKIENHTVSMESFINKIANSFSLQLRNRNNKLNVNLDSKIPKQLKSDSIKISQILINLLNNACKFTEDGQIWLNITLFEDNSDHCMVNFEVKDTGVGISKENFEVIFEAFSNDRLNIKKTHDGSGLGLTIVQKLLKAFDSEVIIESKPNYGSTFSFVIKMNKIAEEVRVTNYSSNNTILEGKNVLVVEDNKINQMLATKMLQKVNALPTICGNGLIGFETFKAKPTGYFDFILMDIHMPIMDGYESALLIKKISPKTPIIALTATNLENDPKILSEKQLDAVIHKPYEIEHVYETVKVLIRTNK